MAPERPRERGRPRRRGRARDQLGRILPYERPQIDRLVFPYFLKFEKCAIMKITLIFSILVEDWNYSDFRDFELGFFVGPLLSSQ